MILTLLVFFLTAFSGALAPVFIKFAVKEIPPLTITAFRFLGGLIIILPFWLKDRQKIKKKDLYKIIPFTLNMSFFSIGIQYTTVLMSQILYSVVPILVAFLGFAFLREKLLRHHIAALIISCIGVIILLEGSIKTHDISSFGSPVGNLIILFAAFSWSFYMIAGRSLSKSYSITTILFYNFTFTSMVLFILLPLEWHIRNIAIEKITYIAVINIIGLSIVSSVLVYFGFQYILKRLSAFVASLSQYLNMVSGTMLGVIFFGERLTIQLILGAIFVVIGLFLATTYQYLQNRKQAVVQ